MKVKALVFDMDGLLLDSEKIALASFQRTCEKFELGDLTDLYMKMLGTNTAETHKILKAHFSTLSFSTLSVEIDNFMDIWFSAYRAETENTPVPLMKGVLELLEYLQSQNIFAAVATSTDTDLATRKLTNSGIIQFFQTITGGDQVENSKPAPDIYLKAAATIKTNPVDCIALEDSPNGVRAAIAAGMRVIQIPDLLQPDEELLQLGHAVNTNLNEVLANLVSGPG